MRTSASGPLALSGGGLRRVVPMITRKRLGSLRLFLRDDEGLVTLEWVALAAAVIVLAIGTIIVIQTQLNTAASTVGSEIVSTVQSNT